MDAQRLIGISRVGIVLFLVVCVFVGTTDCKETSPRTDTVRVVRTIPHDPAAFSQGLVIIDGVLHESTGKYGESTLRRLDMKTGKTDRIVELDPNVFAEGLTELNGQLFQLTWKNKLVYLYDAKTMEWQKTLRYSGEAWGLTHNGKELILSDGTSTIRFLDPKTCEVKRKIVAKTRSANVDQLNELEFINGEIWANIWHTDRIARINPESGVVTGWVECSNLWPTNQRRHREDVLNGIAWDAENKKLYLTGKNWPSIFEVELIPGR